MKLFPLDFVSFQVLEALWGKPHISVLGAQKLSLVVHSCSSTPASTNMCQLCPGGFLGKENVLDLLTMLGEPLSMTTLSFSVRLVEKY